MCLLQAIALATFLLAALLLKLVILAIVDLVADIRVPPQEPVLVLLVLRPPRVEAAAVSPLVEAAVMIVTETILVRLTGVEKLWIQAVPPTVVAEELYTAGFEGSRG